MQQRERKNCWRREAVIVMLKETAEGARDAAEELKRRKLINRQGSCGTATLESERQIEN